MSRTVDTILASIIGKLPSGFALGKRGGVLDAILKAVAQGIATAEADAEQLMNEIDPRTATILLSDFERVLGPDPCGRDLGDPSFATRQKVAHQRWTATGGQSIAYLIGIAAKLGYTITIDEFWPTRAGGLRAGQHLTPEGEQFCWRINLAPKSYDNFKAGASQAGDPLGRIILSGLECELRRIAHSHTTPVFSYLLEEAA